MQNNKQTVIEALHTLITQPEHDEGKIAAYFAADYQQCVDGKTLNYPGFIRHIALIKSQTTKMNIVIKSMAAENDMVFTHHFVHVVNEQGEHSEFEVFACFTLSQKKIIRCEELTRMINGSARDRDLGSRDSLS